MTPETLQKWTDIAAAIVESGMQIKQWAPRHGYDPGYVSHMISKARRAGAPIPPMRVVPQNPPPLVGESQLRDAASRYHSAGKIAEVLGVSPSTILRSLRRHGITPAGFVPRRSTKQRSKSMQAATVMRAREAIDYSRPNGTLYTVAALDGVISMRRAEFMRRVMGLPVFMTLEQIGALR